MLHSNEFLVERRSNADDLEERVCSAHSGNNLQLLLYTHRAFERRKYIR